MIVVFGSINCDFIFKMPVMPLAGQTLLASDFRIEPGGKGANQAVAAAQDGAEVVMVGAVGKDALAETALENLVSEAVDLSRLAQVDKPTGCAAIFIDAEGRNLISVAANANMEAKARQVDDDMLARSDTFVFQMETDPSQIVELARRVRSAGKRMILNLAPAIRLAPDVLALFDLIVINEDEAEALGGWLDCAADCETLSRKIGADVLCTLGANGSQAYFGGQRITVPALAVDVVDTSAAGDCYVGVLAAALDRGERLEAAMKRASYAAGLACAKHGSQKSIPSASIIDAFIT